MNNNQQFFLPTNLLDSPTSSFNKGSQSNNLLGLSFPKQTLQQKKLREKRQKRPPDNNLSYNTYNNSRQSTTPPPDNNPSYNTYSNSLPTTPPSYNNPSIIYDSNSLPTASPTGRYHERGSPRKKRKIELLSYNPSDSFVDHAPSTPILSSVETPPPQTPLQTPAKVKIHDTVSVFTPSPRKKHMIKTQQTKVKDSTNANYLNRDDTVSTLGGDSRIQKFETILQKLEMVLVDLLKNTQRLRRV